jgi:hypothetical protein
MPADPASGRFALLMNAMSRKAFPLGTTAALSLLVSTAAHADECFDTRSSRAIVAVQATTVTSANACILDDGTMRKTSGACGPSVRRTNVSGVTELPAQQPAAR